MIQQLENLRDNIPVKDHLVMYLGHRAPDTQWNTQYQQSATRYLTDPSDISLFGLLVRDVEPNKTDLRGRAKALATNCPDNTTIELIAAYLPAGSIPGIGKRVKLEKEGRHAGD